MFQRNSQQFSIGNTLSYLYSTSVAYKIKNSQIQPENICEETTTDLFATTNQISLFFSLIAIQRYEAEKLAFSPFKMTSNVPRFQFFLRLPIDEDNIDWEEK